MDIISLAVELGKAIQNDERYIKFKILEQNNEEDSELQDIINEFNLKKLAISNEISKEEKDDAKVKSLNEDLKNCYAKILDNENMQNYQKQKQELDKLLTKINRIITGAAQGDDPEWLAENEELASCSGNCRTCGGCH